jgi:2-methylcitrate dehydratase PrpD
MVAIGLIFGKLTSAHYEDSFAADPRIDELREKMACVENPRYSKDYLDPEKRSIANAIQIFFKDGTKSGKLEIEYPIGHRRRRKEGIPELEKKFKTNLARRFPDERQKAILNVSLDQKRLEAMPVHEYVDLFIV